MGINWNETPLQEDLRNIRERYEADRLSARIRDKYTLEEMRKLCNDSDAVKNFLEMLAPKPDW